MSDPLVFIPLVVVAVALICWAWMFRDFWANSNMPAGSPSGITCPPESRSAWTVFFVLLNVFGALFYYVTVYRDRH